MMNSSNDSDLVFRLQERARIRRQILTRKSVQENKPDRIADLLEEAAKEIENAHVLLDKLGISRECNDGWVPLPWTLYARIELLNSKLVYATSEVERLKEFEWMYKDCSK